MILLLLFSGTVHAEPLQQVEVVLERQDDGFLILQGDNLARVITDSPDDLAVKRAAANLSEGISRVSASPAPIAGPMPNLAGTLGQSTLIDAHVSAGNLDISGVGGKWEVFVQQVSMTKHRTTNAGPHIIRIWGIDPVVVIQRIIVMRTELPRSKLGSVGFAPR